MTILILGILGIFMLYVSYRMKKMLFIKELKGDAENLFSKVMHILGAVYTMFELFAMLIGLAVTTVLIWLFFGVALETGINDSEIIYRSYTSFNSFIFLIIALVVFIFGMSQIYSKRIGKIMLAASAVLLIITIVLTYVQTRRYTELSENKFCVYDFGLVKEYDLQEVESFRIYQDNFTKELQFELAFDDGSNYKVIRSVTSCSEKYEEMFYSDYNFVAYYAGMLLERGVGGTLDDRKELEDNANELHENVQKGWQDIVTKMDNK